MSKYKYLNRLPLTLLLSYLLILAIGCKKQGSPEPTADDLIVDGWSEFEQGNYPVADDLFNDALTLDNTSGEGYAGRAWTKAKLDDLPSAEDNIQLAIDNAYSEYHVYILMGALHFVAGEYAQTDSIIAPILLNIQTDWVFSHDMSIGYRDFIIIEAAALYYLGMHTEIVPLITILDATLQPDPTVPASWVLEGHQYSTYAEFLLAVLNRESNLL